MHKNLAFYSEETWNVGLSKYTGFTSFFYVVSSMYFYDRIFHFFGLHSPPNDIIPFHIMFNILYVNCEVISFSH